jgi:hypothetical protein
VNVCASCGFESEAAFKFCPECAAPLVEPASREQRKVVTVLFCDVTGSTELGESMDPEALRTRSLSTGARAFFSCGVFGSTKPFLSGRGGGWCAETTLIRLQGSGQCNMSGSCTAFPQYRRCRPQRARRHR